MTPNSTGRLRHTHSSELSVVVVSPVGEAGGAENFLLDIISGLKRLGVDARLIALGTGPLVAQAHSRGIPTVSGPPLSLRSPLSVDRARRGVRKVFLDKRPDVVLASHPKGQLIARAAGVGMGLKHVTQLYDPPSPAALRDLLTSRIGGLRIAITSETSEAYRSMNAALDPIVIPPAVDLDRLRLEALAGDGERAWLDEGVLGDGPRIVMVARLQRFKGPFDFLAAAREVLATAPHARFLLIGPDSPLEPGLRGELRQVIADSGLEGVVGLAGRLSSQDLASTVQNATLCVHPAHREPFGLAVVEALALGTPVIAYDSPGPRSILHAGGGALVHCGRPSELATSILLALQDRDLMAEWVGETSAVAARFDLPQVVQKYAYLLYGAAFGEMPGGRVTSIGAVPRGPSGVRDYGELLYERLRGRGFNIAARWLPNEATQLRNTAAVSLRLIGLGLSTRRRTVIWHYSPVPYGYRGIPAIGVLLGLILRARGIRVITVLHELAYTFQPGIDGIRGWVKASSQSIALRLVVAGSSAVVVTTERRYQELRCGKRAQTSRTVLVPMFPTILPVAGAPPPSTEPYVLGVPGFSGDGVRADIFLDAIAALSVTIPCSISLLGAPGEHSPAGQMWRRLAHERGVAELVTFSGILEPSELSRRFQACHVIVLVNEEGPSSRKTTLATALVHGLPTVSLDGPNRWSELLETNAVQATDPDPVALTAVLAELHDSPDLRSALGKRGLNFSLAYMNIESAVQAFVALLRG